MREEHLKFIICPKCKNDLVLNSPELEHEEERIKSGKLTCSQCEICYPTINFIPRFVPIDKSDSFGLEWTKHARTQYDNYSGSNVSEKRFFGETKWDRNLNGQIILEVGSGSGRFTEQAASTGAMVISMDYSYAVEANYTTNGEKNNVFIVQADVYAMPFRQEFFDKLFCFGMLQHTPDPQKAFMVLPGYLKRGGDLVVDVYRKNGGFRGLFATKYWVRPITKRLDAKFLYKATRVYITLMWPISKLIHKLPHGRKINWALLVADYKEVYDLNENMLKEWAILDTFDMLSPAYDYPQTLEDVKQWFINARLKDAEVHYGYNGIEGRGKRR